MGNESLTPGTPAVIVTGVAPTNAVGVRAERVRALNAPVDPTKEQSIADQIRELFLDGVQDVVSTGREALQPYADSMVPRIARQIVRRQSDDPDVQASAAEHLDHLRAQAITNAAADGIGLEQRNETRLLTVITMCVNAGLRFIKP